VKFLFPASFSLIDFGFVGFLVVYVVIMIGVWWLLCLVSWRLGGPWS